MSRPAFAKLSLTTERGISRRPSADTVQPCLVHASMQEGIALSIPIVSRTSRTASLILGRSSAFKGLKSPPSCPGRTGFMFSGRAVALLAFLAFLPPMRCPELFAIFSP